MKKSIIAATLLCTFFIGLVIYLAYLGVFGNEHIQFGMMILGSWTVGGWIGKGIRSVADRIKLNENNG